MVCQHAKEHASLPVSSTRKSGATGILLAILTMSLANLHLHRLRGPQRASTPSAFWFSANKIFIISHWFTQSLLVLFSACLDGLIHPFNYIPTSANDYGVLTLLISLKFLTSLCRELAIVDDAESLIHPSGLSTFTMMQLGILGLHICSCMFLL